MGMKFLNKKGWHTGSMQNQERVWKAEQKHEAEQKKMEELKKQITEERAKAEFRELQEKAGIVQKQERLEFLYESGMSVGKPSTEEYLLGKPLEEPKNETVIRKMESVPGALFTEEDKPASANETWRKIHTDPLFLIRQQEQAALQRIRSNPIQMEILKKKAEEKKSKREQKLEKQRLKEERRAKRKARKERKAEKKAKHNKRKSASVSSSSSSDDSSDDGSEMVKPKPPLETRSGEGPEEPRGLADKSSSGKDGERFRSGEGGYVGRDGMNRFVSREAMEQLRVGNDRLGKSRFGQREGDRKEPRPDVRREACARDDDRGRYTRGELGIARETRDERGRERGSRGMNRPHDTDFRVFESRGGAEGRGRGGDTESERGRGGERETGRGRVRGDSWHEERERDGRGERDRRVPQESMRDGSSKSGVDSTGGLRDSKQRSPPREDKRDVGHGGRRVEERKRRRNDSSEDEEDNGRLSSQAPGKRGRDDEMEKSEEDRGADLWREGDVGDVGQRVRHDSPEGEENGGRAYGLKFVNGHRPVAQVREPSPEAEPSREVQAPRVRHRAGMLTEEEKAKRLAEMQADADVHEEQRWSRLQKASHRDSVEDVKAANEAQRAAEWRDGGRSTFLDKAGKDVYGGGDGGGRFSNLEESVKRRAHFHQRGMKDASTANAFRR